MTISYNLTRDDKLQFVLYYLKHSPSCRKSRGRYIAFIFLVSLIVSIIQLRDSNLPTIVVSMIIFGLLTFVVAPIYYDWMAKRRINIMLKEDKNASFLTPTTLNIEQDGLYIDQDKVIATIKWNGIEKIDTTASHIFLYTSAANAITIPNAAFESVAEREKFLDMVMHYRESAAGLTAELA